MQNSNDSYDIQAVPAFGLEEEKGFKPIAWDLEAAHKHLLHFLANKPKALLQHVQRIHVAIMDEDNAKIYAALLDFCLVLGGKGQAIRAEMLSLATSFLTEEQLSFFLERAHTGVTLDAAAPSAVYSLFSLGLEGDRTQLEEPCEMSLWSELNWGAIAALLK